MPRAMETLEYGPLEEHLLDYYEAESPETKPLFIFFHGGGLEGGDRRSGSEKNFTYLRKRGFSTASADYRLYPKVSFPDFILDAALCVNWCRENLKYSELYIGGSSAGAYLSMMLAFDKHYLGEYGINADDKEQISGYFFDAGQPTVHFNILRERGLDTRLIRVDEAAPVYYINEAKSPDTLPRYQLLVSDNDMMCRFEQNRMLYKTMLYFGYPTEKVRFKLVMGYSHCEYCDAVDVDNKPLYSKFIEQFILNKH